MVLLFEQVFEKSLPRGSEARETVGVKTMSKKTLQSKKVKRSRRANIRLAFAMQAGAGSKDLPTKAGSYVTVTLAPGETLWSLAKALNNGGDVRELVDTIIKVNGLTSSDIAAGSKIRVPLN
ncbi:MAG: hypothetical protein RLZ80_854 [Actinomycetota bacterium]